MFQFSRATYRHLAPDLDPSLADADRRLLEGCEAAVHRLATDRRYFAHPAKRLFRDVRHCFPLAAHERVWHVIAAHVAAGERYLDTTALDDDGAPKQCPATTRSGHACRREPLRNGYCPSHQHLAADSLAA